MRLFVYGVLIRELARGHAANLIERLGPGRSATVRGRLFALETDSGWYPVLLPDPGGDEVHGYLHDAGGVDWEAMDAFENAQGGPEAEYVRREIEVGRADGPVTSAFAYCYARTLPAHAQPVPQGDFASWLRDTGRTAFG